MKAHSNRGNPAAVKSRKILTAITHGYRFAVLQPFPAHGLTTLFRVFHATFGRAAFSGGSSTRLCYGSSYPYFYARRPFSRTFAATRSLTACGFCRCARSAVLLAACVEHAWCEAGNFTCRLRRARAWFGQRYCIPSVFAANHRVPIPHFIFHHSSFIIHHCRHCRHFAELLCIIIALPLDF